MSDALAELGDAERALAPAAPVPGRARLMQATLDREPFSDPGSAHRNRDGETMFPDACRRGWEGVVGGA